MRDEMHMDASRERASQALGQWLWHLAFGIWHLAFVYWRMAMDKQNASCVDRAH